ncbi:hypothetical protein M405DRAFT_34414 [Rhizopogon salebrosus TDB-379]|nr:hypothetical protein M405DRAFT_34414 [Rhizopogon salebrosus TDB-379]
MRSFHYLSVTSWVFSLFYSQLVAGSGVQSSTHDRSRGLAHKRVPSNNNQPHGPSANQLGDRIFSKRDQFTYFQDGQGACGTFNSPSDFIVALNSCDYDGGAHCFQTITITVNGKSTQAQITDECPGCPCGGLDLSEALFGFFAPVSEGELSGTWTYGDGGTSTTSTPLPSTTKQSSTSTWTPSTTSTTVTTSSTPITTSMSTSTSISTSTPLPSTTTSSTASPVPTFNPDDPQMLTQVNLALIELGSVLQSCAAMSF